jgi:hypothetical protein
MNTMRADKEKARLLLEMARITLERLDKLDKLLYTSNTVNDYYDILHKLMESFASLKGLKFSGINAHKRLIDFICDELFGQTDKNFLQNLRNHRNQMSYEGFNIPADFLKRNDARIREYIAFLTKKIEEKLGNDKKK